MAKFSKIYLCNTVRRMAAIMLVFVLALMVGCGQSKTSSDGSNTGNSSISNNGNSGASNDGSGSASNNGNESGSVNGNSGGVGNGDASGNGNGSGNSGGSGNQQNSNNSSNSNKEIDPLEGEVSVDMDVQTVVARDDEGELLPESATAVLGEKITSVAEDEVNALRNKILSTGNTEEYYKITGTKYYISPGGDDENKGTSPEQAFRTVDALSGISFEKGDAVLFERDSVFRISSAISTKKGVIYGSYGEGDKPKIYASGMNFATAEWKPTQRKNIWRTMYIYDAAGTMILNHGEAVGYRKTSVRNLTENLQFFQSEEDGYLYLYCDKGNPSAVYDSIEVTADIRIFFIPSRSGDVVIDNLCLMYSSSFAVSGNYNCHGVTVTNCEIGYIGGYARNGTTRLGNAIQMWTGIQGLTVENNWIYQTFDTAITWQGNGGEGCEYSDISIKGNLMEYNHTDIEFWDDGATLNGFTITDNIFRLTQMGWGARTNDGGIRGFDGAFYGNTGNMKVLGKIIVKNNLIDSPGGRIFRWETNQGDWDKYFEVSGTRIYITGKYRYTDQVVRGTYGSGTTADNSYATNADELKVAFQRIDPTIEVKWQ